MATFTKTVDPNGGSNYVSLSAWEAGEQGLYVSGDIAVADCKRTGATKDTTAVTIAGWTAGVVPKIIVNPAYRHNGIPGVGYVLGVAGTPLTVATGATVVDGLEVTGFGAAGVTRYGIDISNGGVVVSNCLVHTAPIGTANVGIRLPSSATTSIAYNNIIYGVGGTAGHGIQARHVNNVIENCTVYDCITSGVSLLAAATVTNTACFNSGIGFNGASSASSDYNVSSDTTAPGTNKATGKTAYTSYFVDPANGDFHLKNTSLALFGLSGADLSGTFTTDIDGTTRSAPWDIGADQYVAAGGGTITGTLATTQQIQSQTLAAALRMYGTISQGQPHQAEAASALLRLVASAAQSQQANSEAINSTLRFIGTVAETQTRQQQYIVQALTAISGVVSQTQAHQIASLTAKLAFSGASEQTQAKQVESLAAVLRFIGSSAQAQAAQQEAITAILGAVAITGAVTQAQAIQLETLAAVLRISGSVDQSQAAQRQIVLEMVAAIAVGNVYRLPPEQRFIRLAHENRMVTLSPERRLIRLAE